MGRGRRFARTESGQMTLEMTLILALMVGVMITFSKFMKDKGIMKTLVEGPWKPVQGMIENAAWAPPEKTKKIHPTIRSRHGSFNGDEPK